MKAQGNHYNKKKLIFSYLERQRNFVLVGLLKVFAFEECVLQNRRKSLPDAWMVPFWSTINFAFLKKNGQKFRLVKMNQNDFLQMRGNMQPLFFVRQPYPPGNDPRMFPQGFEPRNDFNPFRQDFRRHRSHQNNQSHQNPQKKKHQQLSKKLQFKSDNPPQTDVN